MNPAAWGLDAVMVGDSPAMRRLRRQVEQAAGSELPVLVHGETGSGKELVALELHRRSARPGAFVPVNASASELRARVHCARNSSAAMSRSPRWMYRSNHRFSTFSKTYNRNLD